MLGPGDRNSIIISRFTYATLKRPPVKQKAEISASRATKRAQWPLLRQKGQSRWVPRSTNSSWSSDDNAAITPGSISTRRRDGPHLGVLDDHGRICLPVITPFTRPQIKNSTTAAAGDAPDRATPTRSAVRCPSAGAGHRQSSQSAKAPDKRANPRPKGTPAFEEVVGGKSRGQMKKRIYYGGISRQSQGKTRRQMHKMGRLIPSSPRLASLPKTPASPRQRILTSAMAAPDKRFFLTTHGAFPRPFLLHRATRGPTTIICGIRAI